nr:reverse transcriptase domain-containing protein [Tanacetum cinerariifolium]
MFEELELDRQEPDKLVVGKPGLINKSLIEIVTPILIWNETVLIVPLNILVVGHGRKTMRSNLIRHHLRTITGISLVVINCGGLRYIFLNIVTVNVAIGGWTISFYGLDKEDPHAHIHYFNKITSTLKFSNVPNTSIKLMLFPFSLEGAARIWLEKELPRSILTWDDLVSKFINQFFPPSKTNCLRNEITNFQQRFDETFSEAWDRFKDLLRARPHHGFSELHQLDTFYNALNSKDQDSLNSAAGCNFLDKMPRDCLSIIESKSKVHYSRDKPVVAKVSMTASTSGVSPDVAELKDLVRALLLDKKGQNQSPTPVKAVEESCVTCSGAHSYRNCPATDGNIYRDNIQ